jgi:hypothetical protein
LEIRKAKREKNEKFIFVADLKSISTLLGLCMRFSFPFSPSLFVNS